ncbi:heterokaryon incompatibility protein-domain-containing protein [Hypoxylon rubiginosum]|uniref:Heterokaryon incompatibility protein-domain-containing protein n=1 Tax=Hypoxylon rubiginosum TaxID=110542 RepID=A0ACC0DHT8_9PEZI|nr:heterokaryon incompatibility protein-domain-containing protein [Hypoxylon rubiginosum]
MEGDTVIDITSLKSIKLLSLEPSKNFYAPLIGALQLVSLDDPDCPSFNALSYVWGTFASEVDTLRCGTDDFQITTNCKDALRQLRHLYGGITLWVDSICIDQGNDEEKQHQISLMQEIYMRAERVYVWIGNETPELKSAIECLVAAARIDHAPIHPERTKFPTNLFQQDSLCLRIARLMLLSLTPYLCFQVLLTRFRVRRLLRQYEGDNFDKLFTQEWFLRAWTFQETVLAYNPVIICGSFTIDWDTFVRGFRCVNYFLKSWHLDLARPGRPDSTALIYREPMQNIDEMLPPSFQVFSRVINLWMKVKRPRSGLGIRRLPSSVESFSEYREAHCGIQVYFLPESSTPGVYKPLLLTLAILLFLRYREYSKIWLISTLIMGGFVINRSILASLRRDRGEDEKKDQIVLLEGVVQTLRQRKATDPKDKVFALYGVLDHFGLRLTTPDYSKSPAQIYHELFLALLRRNSSAIVLLIDAGQYPDNTDEAAMVDAPSWVPNWNRQPSLSIPDDWFKASDPYVNLSQGPNKLVVSACLKGQVTFCREKFPKIDLKGKDIPSLYKAVGMFVSWDQAVTNAHSRRPSSAWYGVPVRPKKDRPTLESFCRKTQEVKQFFAKAMDDFRSQNEYCDLTTEILLDLLEDKTILACFIEIINDLADDDDLSFITSHGSLGFGSNAVLTEDRIALIEGVPAALLLRPHDTSNPNAHVYSVICSATILGIQEENIDYQGEITLL